MIQEYQLVEGFDPNKYLRFNTARDRPGAAVDGPRGAPVAGSIVGGFPGIAGSAGGIAGVRMGRYSGATATATAAGRGGGISQNQVLAAATAVMGGGGAGRPLYGGRRTKEEETAAALAAASNYFVLSMGHRIQFLQYDSAGVRIYYMIALTTHSII